MTTNTSKLSTWLFWAPLRFAISTFFAVTLTGILYIIISALIFSSTPIPQAPLGALTSLVILYCIYLTERKLPRNELDQASFVMIHNAQTIFGALLSMISSYMIIRNINEIAFKLMLLENQSTLLFILTITLSTIFLLYIPGILITNFFAKFRRIQSFDIPTWKIICSIPFGFSALWIPGYILNTRSKPETHITTKITWYKKLTNLVLSNPTNTIITFIPVTLMSGFLFGLYGILLALIFSLIFGIWMMQIGQKKFIKNIGGLYASISVIINIVLIMLTICMFIFTPTPTQNIQINISETQQTTNQ